MKILKEKDNKKIDNKLYNIRYPNILSRYLMKNLNTIVNKNYIKLTFGESTVYDKFACFDLDHTIIKPKNNKRFPKKDDENDWEFYNFNVAKILRSFHLLKYNILIISNQKKLNDNLSVWVNKIKNVIKILNIPITIIGLISDKYRKPLPTIWNENYSNYSKGSFYCGDACGLDKRIVNYITLPKDFSDVDIKFALNCNLQFKSRDDLIIRYQYDSLKNYIVKYPDITKLIKSNNFNNTLINKLNNMKKTMIINVGYSGCGKTYFSKKLNYIHINNDTNSAPKIKNLLNNALQNSDNIIIDNTNLNTINRLHYIDIAKKNNYNIICLYFNISLDICKHNNIYRHYKYNQNIIPDIAYNVQKKTFVEPSISEGFGEIIKIDYIINNDKDYLLYMY